ncbi:hypothetical protein MX659_01205 [Coriobacteriia bacterium Es71-Z0120]|uniref:septal ring lytic transglycosylase RlpA family protein n=1 Tax=Parvivirga hydrogeniphila TaxID=2939460 RepID=UPI002260FBEF|nr:RlpA-like double-psi beta-barrel domain-containing protein [Parvivirga hydrogeniphila]MCL4078230.1 hypothetical protein [Parvivirga hydrogeniphila]
MSVPVTGGVGAVALAVALVIGSGLAPAAGLSAIEERPTLSQAPATAATVLEAKSDSVEAAGAPTTPALAAVALKTATPIAKPKAKPAVKRRPAQRKQASEPSGWRTARASWYGPGFYGHTMAGGGTLTPTSMVVAHRTLPFGTKVEIEYKGRRVIAVVKDRGPYVRGRTFDLGPGTAKALGFSGVGTIRWRIVR